MIIERNVKAVCSEDISLIENYEMAINDTTQVWICHHKLGLNISKQELIDKNLYFNRPASELIFLTKSEHISLHASNRSKETLEKLSNTLKGRVFSEEHKKHLSKSKIGKNLSDEHKQKIRDTMIVVNPFKGKHHTEEAKQKISEALTGKHLSEEHKQKLSLAFSGENNPMYGKSAMKGKHHSKESLEKMSIVQKQYNKEHPEVIEARAKSVRNTRFMNNGLICKRIPLDKCEEYRNNGFVFGMLNTGK